MSPISVALLSLSMSADAFAASIGQGASSRPNVTGAIRGGLIFGIIEALTPLLGWGVGMAASSFIASIDHWVVFTLLAVVGGKMIWEGLRAEEERDRSPSRIGIAALVMTAVATSIDAAAVGVSLALIGANILVIALSIGATTFTVTTAGLLLGKACGDRFGCTVEVLGGLVLLAMGTVILTEHLGLITTSLF